MQITTENLRRLTQELGLMRLTSWCRLARLDYHTTYAKLRRNNQLTEAESEALTRALIRALTRALK